MTVIINIYKKCCAHKHESNANDLHIIKNVVAQTPPTSRNYLPTTRAQKSKILLIRNKSTFQKEPYSIEDIDIPPSLYSLEASFTHFRVKGVPISFRTSNLEADSKRKTIY